MSETAGHYRIRIGNSGEVYACEPGQTVLAGMEASGCHGIPVGCRGGGCGVCKIRIRAGSYQTGKMSRACLSEEERTRHIALACKTYPSEDMELEAVGMAARC